MTVLQLGTDATTSAGFQVDLVNTLAIVLGQARAQQAVDGFVALIKTEAAKGASKKVTPLLIGSLAVSTLAAGLAIFAATRKR